MKAWLFDVDGVITNPELKKTNPEILEVFIKFLKAHDIIGLNTGRSLEFIISEVLNPLENIIQDKKLLDRIYSIGEKGGAWAWYKNYILNEAFDESLKPPIELEIKIKEIIKDKYSETTFYDETKKTMISTELIKGSDLKKYKKEQESFTIEIKKLIKEYDFGDLTIEPTLIATDIQNIRAGKDLGVQRFLDLISSYHEPEEFETFGDSPGDLEMHLHLKKLGHKSKFIYAGKKDLDTHEDYIKTKEYYDKGTLEYLNNL